MGGGMRGVWKFFDEPVELIELRLRYFPRLFRWRGQRHEVETIDRCWVVSRPGWRERVERRFFLVQCSGGTFELYQDLQSGIWHLRRARLGAVQAAAWRRVAPALR